jgi:acetyl-CoA carboxylase biotin carboxyl carrier protein
MEERVDLKDIKAIIDLMKKNSISEFELEKQDFKVKLKRGGMQIAQHYEESTQTLTIPVGPSTSSALPVSTVPVASAVSSDLEIKSPMIGTFYGSPSPESANYVQIGSEVGPDTVVCIIEAMKVMNEIKAEARGIITEVLIDNAKPVEFGQPIFKIRPI